MAAGKGTRLKSELPKVLHRVGGKPMLAHVIAAAAHLVAPQDVYCIIGFRHELVQEAVASTGVRFVVQEEQHGTGHAIMTAAFALRGYDHVIVLSGDVPLIRRETLEQLRDYHLAQRGDMTLISAEMDQPFGYGRVLRKRTRGGNEVAAIVEQKALRPGQERVREINSGIYAFAVPPLLAHLNELSTDNPAHEYYLTDMAAVLGRAGKRVLVVKAGEAKEVLGGNTRADLAEMDAFLRDAKGRALMEAGVTIYRPETCVIDPDVEVAPDVVIEPFVQLLGRTRVGRDCVLRSYSVIKDSTLGAGVLVRPGCVLDDATIGDGALLGPYSHLRPGSEIGAGAHVGNFVETKKVRLGRGAKANHLTYLGDADIGEGVNVGAGTITCNYDGVHKHKTVIGPGAFIGSDSTLVAPVTVGKGAYVGAASCITEDVPDDALALGRARQIVKPGWAERKRKKN